MTRPTRSPWGAVQHVHEYAPGVWSVDTASHGGIKLDRKHNAQVHAAWRAKGGWYEEAADWAIVALSFPTLFTAEQIEAAERTARNWLPDAYEAATGRLIPPGESRVRAEAAFKAAHVADYVVVAASGDWADWVPQGFVGVSAQRADNGAVGNFLVPKDEYAARSPFGFVVDESQHQRVAGA